MTEPNLELVQREMALFAAEGQYGWRRVLGADVALLVGLPNVQTQLATSTTPEIDPDAELNAIVAATTEAIEHLRQPFRDAAREQFGFTDPNPKAPRKKGARETDAAEKLGISKRTYELPSAKYGGASPRDQIIRLVARALCGVSDPISFITERESGADDKAVANGGWTTSIALRFVTRHRWPAVIASISILAVVILAVTLLGHGRGRSDTSTVDIGRAFAQAPTHVRRPFETVDETAGITLKVCMARVGCRDPSAKQVVAARPGDLVSFRLDLNDSYEEPIARMNLAASTATHNGVTEVTVVAEWKVPLATAAIESRTETARVAVQDVTPSGLPRLVYVPGTTKLYTLIDTHVPEEVLSLSLPDGLFTSSGLTLEQVGPRRQYPTIRLADVSNIHFDMRVATGGL
ncbi:MAG TPA: hypothetical protein VG147_07920 [Solirubrobacteraceae bacterium]|jgi:hypothetical protein|nr:hypothetical protein [Solirubrobacteraceae bacterium]